MPPDPLATVLQLRQRAVDEARRNLAASLDAASAAANAIKAADRAIGLESDLASDPEGGDSLVDAFAAWLPGARHRVAQAAALYERQEAEAARCRAELTASRTALESIEQLIAEREAAKEAEEDRREQQGIDEMAGRVSRNQAGKHTRNDE